jgi:xanthine/CO dehydrogenase XdhC/CoxF family maturation factor
VGLSCGGQITVFVERHIAFDERSEERQVWEKLSNCLDTNLSCVLVSQLIEEVGSTAKPVRQDHEPIARPVRDDGGKATALRDVGDSSAADNSGVHGGHTLVMPDGSNLGQPASTQLLEAVHDAYLHRRHALYEESGKQFFIQVMPRRSQMLIIGAAHITVDLVDFAKAFDFETIVIDPRGAFANKTQFQTEPDAIIEKYPSEVIPDYTLDTYTYAVILSHDPKIDDNALHLLLKSEVAYIGALGSKKTHAKRVARLREAGFSDEQIDRIHAPIGENINAKKPREIALSIIAQIISVQNKAE